MGHVKDLRGHELGHCVRITDVGARDLTDENMSTLVTMTTLKNLGNCKKITDFGVRELV